MSVMSCALCDKFVDTDYYKFIFLREESDEFGWGICEQCFENLDVGGLREIMPYLYPEDLDEANE